MPNDEFINSEDARAVEERRMIADEMKALLDMTTKNGESRRKILATKLVMNMDKSPEWYKLALKLLGEMPAEQSERKPTDDLLQDYLDSLLESGEK